MRYAHFLFRWFAFKQFVAHFYRPMLARIFNSSEYLERYHELFSEFITEYFDSGKFVELIDSTESMIETYVENDPTKFCTYDEFKTGVDRLKSFCLLRAESISGQLNGR